MNKKATEKKATEKKAYKRPISSKYLALVLYPDFNVDHMCVLEYIKTNSVLYPEVLYIRHDMDIDSPEGYSPCIDDLTLAPYKSPVLEKIHYHVFIECVSPVTASGFLGRFVVNNRALLSHVELVNDPVAYVQYMIHADFNSVFDACKHQYSANDLIGSAKWRSKALEPDSIETSFENLEDMYNFISDNGLASFFHNCRSLPPKQMHTIYRVFSANQSVALKADQRYWAQALRNREEVL